MLLAWLHCSGHAATQLSVITGCYIAMTCSSREVTSALTALFAASVVIGSAVLMTVCVDGSYTRHTQQSHDLSSSGVDPCELPDSLCGVMVKPYHRQLLRSNLRTP